MPVITLGVGVFKCFSNSKTCSNLPFDARLLMLFKTNKNNPKSICDKHNIILHFFK